MKNGSVMAESVPPKATPMAFLVSMFGVWLTTTRVPSSANSLIFMPAPKKGGQNPMKRLSWQAEKWAKRKSPVDWWGRWAKWRLLYWGGMRRVRSLILIQRRWSGGEMSRAVYRKK